MKKYRVVLVKEAEDDLLDIYFYVAANDSGGKADHLLTQLEALCHSLSAMPRRGHVCPELKRVGVTDYREVHYKPYRAIYEIAGHAVYVHAVLDGRRDLQSILESRLTRQRR